MDTITFNQTTAIEYQNKIDALIAALPPAPADQRAEYEANARLIAAAPDLLAALKYLRSEITLNHAPICPMAHGSETCTCELADFEQKCDTAIAKAEGGAA